MAGSPTPLPAVTPQLPPLLLAGGMGETEFARPQPPRGRRVPGRRLPPYKARKRRRALEARRGAGEKPAARAVLPRVPAPDAHRAQQLEVTSADSQGQLFARL